MIEKIDYIDTLIQTIHELDSNCTVSALGKELDNIEGLIQLIDVDNITRNKMLEHWFNIEIIYSSFLSNLELGYNDYNFSKKDIADIRQSLQKINSLLNKVVNRSIGSQIMHQTKHLKHGDRITKVKVIKE